MILVLGVGCSSKKKNQLNQEKIQSSEEIVTLKPYSLPLPDSVKSRQFKNGFKNIEEFGEAIVHAVVNRDTKSLSNIMLEKDEYIHWIWPEEPSSDPKFNIPLDFAWENLYRDSKKGLKVLMKKYGGKDIKFVSLTLPGKKIKHQTYTFHRDPELKITLPDGNEDVISEIGTIVEMNGLYKVLFYRKD